MRSIASSDGRLDLAGIRAATAIPNPIGYTALAARAFLFPASKDSSREGHE